MKCSSLYVRSPRFKSLKDQLGLYFDDNGLRRCKGRLQNTSIPFDAKHPILLPADHHLTVPIINDCHQRVLQDGVKETLTELRYRFWITKGRHTVRKVLRSVGIARGPKESILLSRLLYHCP